MNGMFQNCSSLTSLDLGNNFDTSSVTNMSSMFYNCTSLTSLELGDSFNTSKVTNMNGMFQNCSSLTSLDLKDKFDTSNVTDMYSMFKNCSSLTSLELGVNFDTSKVKNMSYMFSSCSRLTNLDLGDSFDTSKVTDMRFMFSDCSSLTSLDLGEEFNTSNVTYMYYMFQNCSSLTSLNLGNSFDISAVPDMSSIFSGCSALNTFSGKLKLNASNAATTMSDMFYGCKALKTVDFFEVPSGGAAFDGLSLISGMFSGCTSLEKVDLSGWSLPNLTNLENMFSGCTSLRDIDLSWSGMRAAADDLNLINTFSSVPSTAKLEIGADPGEALQAIAAAFPGSVTSDGQPWPSTNGINGLPLTGEPTEEPGNVLDPSASEEEGPVTDEPSEEVPGGPVEEPDAGETPDGPGGGPDTPDTPPEDETQPPEAATPPADTTPPAEPVTPGADAGTPEEPETTPEPPAESGEEEPPAPSEQPEDTPEDPGAAEESPAPSEEPEAPVETGEPEGEDGSPADGGVAAAAMLAYRARAVGVSTPTLLAGGDGVSAQANENSSITVHPEATNVGSAVQYRIRVKYVGDPGAQSGQIQLNFPIPDDVHVLTAEELGKMKEDDKPKDEDGKAITADDLLTVSDRQYSSGAAGYLGGRVVVEPYVDSTDSDNPVLRGTFEGLYTGNEYEIAIWCVLDTSQNTDGDYSYWDGTAYAQDKAASAASNVYRLWWKDNSGGGDVTPPTPTGHTVTYQFQGDVPDDAVLPSGGVYDAGDTVNVAAEPTTSYSYYEFGGWTSEDVTISNNSFEMPSKNVTLTGTWTIVEAQAPKITVTYQYQNYGEDGYEHVPNGAPELPGEVISGDNITENHVHAQAFMVGNNASIVDVRADADHHIFMGWTPKLTIDGTEVKLSDNDNDGVYTGIHSGVNYSIPTSGLLQTEQFRGAADASDPDKVTVAYEGPWRPYTADIIFNGNGGETETGDTTYQQENVTWDTHATLTTNQFVHSGSYDFVGWSLAPSGAVARADGGPASGLITEDGTDVTLYAQWKRDTYGVGYNLTHVTSSNTDSSVNRGDSYTTILKPESGYEMDSVVVTMGGVTVPNAYNPADGSVTVSGVDDTIIITATAVPVSTPPVTRHTITISVAGGTASHSGTVQVNDGDDLSITFTPNSGYKLKSVTVDGSPANLTGNSYTFTDVTSDHTIAVVYEKDSGGGSGGGGSTGGGSTGGGSTGGGGGGGPTEHPIKVEDTGNGTASSDKDEAAKGEDVTITADGEVIDITVTDESGKEVPITDNGDGSFTFEMPGSGVTVKVEFEPFEVVDPDDTGVSGWLNTTDHIAYLSGYDTGNFGPTNNMTRAEAAQMFYNLLLNKDVPITVSFTDVAAEAWYSTAVNTLASLGMLQGVGDNQFTPERAITRAEFTAIAMRFAELDTSGENIFSDVSASDWFYDYVVGSIQYGWITGYEDGTFRPNNTITRAEVTAITNRMLGRAADEDYVDAHRSELRQFPDLGTGYWAYYQIMEATNAHTYSKNDGVEIWRALQK